MASTAQKQAYLVLTVLLLSAILLPFGIGLDLGPGPNKIRALIWEYLDAPWFSGYRFVRVGQILEGILYTLPIYFFIAQIFKYYKTGAMPKRVIVVGILGALFPALVSLIQVIGWLKGWTQPPPPISDHYFPIYIPIPTTPILAIVLVRIFPARNTTEKADG